MNKTVILILFPFLLSACKKEPELSVAERMKKKSNGTLTALMNGQSWSHPISIFDFGGGSTFSANTYLYEGNTERQVFYFNTIYLSLKLKQKIYRDISSVNGRLPTSGFLAKKDDLIENAYLVDTSADNYIIVNSYNAATGEIDGTFQLVLYRELAHARDTSVGLADVLQFTEGKFHADLQ